MKIAPCFFFEYNNFEILKLSPTIFIFPFFSSIFVNINIQLKIREFFLSVLSIIPVFYIDIKKRLYSFKLKKKK